jgi:hypothetical protein
MPLSHLHALLDATLRARQARDAGLPVDLDALRALLAHAEADAASAPREGAPVSDAEAREAFASGALRLLYYHQTVHTGRPILDTLGSKTLPEFEPDLSIQDADDTERWRADIARVCLLSPDQLRDIEQTQLARELDALARRQRLMDALDAHLGLATRGRDAALDLLRAVFPGAPLDAHEVDLICTSTALYLCLPYSGERWTTRGDDQANDPRLVGLLRRITRPQQATMAYFPAFAPIRKPELDHALLRAISDRAGLSIEDARELLPTMITILPRDEVDKYIVHDVWGHQWQAHLFRFEEAYQRVALMASAPALSPALLSALGAHIDGDADAREAWDDALDALLSQNLTDSLSGLLAEVLADAVEYKFLVLHPERRADLLSSSFFKELPTKLDLTLADLPLYFRFATRGLRRLTTPEARPALLAQLAAALPHASDAQLAAAIDAAASWTLDALEAPARWAPRPSSPDAPGAFDRAALSFAQLQRAFNALHEQLPPQPHPLLARFHDLLVFTAAAFFERDPAHNLTRLTHFISHHFPRLYAAL